MAESFESCLMRWKFRLFPCYRGTGARVRYVAADFREIRVEIPLSWRTSNYVGTIFGGSMFGAADPIFMLMLIHILGDGYTVWDKAGSVRFLKPGRTTFFGTFVVDEATTGEIVASLETERSIDRHFRVDLVDADGVLHAEIEKTIFIKKKVN